MVTDAPPKLFGRGIAPAAAVGREKPLIQRETIEPGATEDTKLAPSSRPRICCGETVTVICWLAVFPWVLYAVVRSTCWPTDAAGAFQANVYGGVVRLARSEPSRKTSI